MSVFIDKLMPSSPCDRKHPLFLAYRIVRICSEPESRDKRLSELKELLLSRNYKNSLVDTAIEKARKIPRCEAIKRISRNQNKPSRPVLALTFDPRLPCIPQILKKHWRTMVKADPHLAETFPLPPLTAYRRPANIRDKLIRSKIPQEQTRERRNLPGMKTCGKNLCHLPLC